MESARHCSDDLVPGAAERPPEAAVTITREPTGRGAQRHAAADADGPLCSALVRTVARRLRLPPLTLREVIVDDLRLAADDPRVGDGLHALLLDAAWGDWHAVVVRPPAAVEAPVLDAAWRVAIRLDAACLVRRHSGGVEAVIVRGPRGAIGLLGAVDAAGTLRRLPGMLRRMGMARVRRWLRPERLLPYALDLPAAPVPLRPLSEGVRFTEISPDEARRHPLRYADSARELAEMLQRGDRCLAGLAGPRVVFRLWVATDRAFIGRYFDERAVRWPAAYVHDVRTAAAYRGRGLFPAALRWLADHPIPPDARQLLSAVWLRNESSRRAMEKAGMRRVAEAARGENGTAGPRAQGPGPRGKSETAL